MGALALLVFSLPLFLPAALLVFLQDGGPVLFVQRRIGRGGTLFPCLKLRTMVVGAEEQLPQILSSCTSSSSEWASGRKLQADPRITPLGRFLRKSSLDELPQLLNVLRGEMSLVGPRPIVPEEAPRYGQRLRAYCSVPPGLTGLWQVSGRNSISYRRRIACDVVYARRRSASLNVALALRTIPAVLRQDGAG
jgi:lipopolysaccharide/colanic/teichoic acid biosynthesis glycosyltransferase